MWGAPLASTIMLTADRRPMIGMPWRSQIRINTGGEQSVLSPLSAALDASRVCLRRSVAASQGGREPWWAAARALGQWRGSPLPCPCGYGAELRLPESATGKTFPVAAAVPGCPYDQLPVTAPMVSCGVGI